MSQATTTKKKKPASVSPMTAHLSVTYRRITDLKPNPENPRIHSKKQVFQIARSIQEFGFTAPVLVDAQLNVIAGHGRILASKELGWKEVPTISLDHLTDAQKKAYLIADNKLTENAKWDEKLLAQQFLVLSKLDLDFGIDITGFEMGEIDVMIENLSIIDANEPDPADELPMAPTGKPVSKVGDLWLLGNHRLYCGNSLEAESFATLMGDKKADMVFVDPPYNVPIEGHVSGLGAVRHREFAMASGEMSEAEFTDFLTRACQMLANHSVDGSIHYVCMDWRHMSELLAAGKKAYAELKNLCVWAKDNGGMGTFYRSQHELIFVFKRGTAPHKNHFELGQHGRYRTNVWEYPGINSFSRQSNEGNLLELHPTVKPVAMVADAIMDCSDRGDIILDSFLGSGTTLIAAERSGRVCYGMELDPLYVDTAIRRWQLFKGKKATHAESGLTFEAMEAAHG